MKSQRLIALAALIIAATATFLFFWDRNPPPAQTATSPIPAISEPPSPAPSNIAADPVSVSGDKASLQTDFESNPDLRAFMNRLKAAANAGDPEAIWWTYRTWDYCKSYASNPANFSRDTESMANGVPSAAAAGLKGARGKVESRCKGFSGDKIPSDAELNAMLSAAAKAGNLAAEAATISRKINTTAPDGYVKDLVARVRSSDDPQAYLALSEAMGVSASARPDLFGAASGTNYSTFAWQLAACGKGLDCSATGSLMTSYCTNGGMCGQFSDFRDMVFNGLVPRAEANRINELISKISN